MLTVRGSLLMRYLQIVSIEPHNIAVKIHISDPKPPQAFPTYSEQKGQLVTGQASSPCRATVYKHCKKNNPNHLLNLHWVAISG